MSIDEKKNSNEESALSDTQMKLYTKMQEIGSTSIVKRLDKAKECTKNGRGLYFWGNTGTGKTYILRNFYDGMKEIGMGCRRISMIDYSIACRQSFSDSSNFHYDLEKRKKTAYLFIDDLGVEKASDYTVETLYSIIEYRYTHNLCTFITSNQSLENIGEKYNRQMESRIREKCKVVHFAGEDKRKKMGPSF